MIRSRLGGLSSALIGRMRAIGIGNNHNRTRLLALAAATTTTLAAAALLRPSQVSNEPIPIANGSSSISSSESPKLSLPELYERCSKSVVHLRLEVKTADELQAKNLVTNGSGFVINPAGLDAAEPQNTMLILTNAHVVTDMSIRARLSVRFCDGTVVSGQVVCIDAASDLALVRPSFRSSTEEAAARLKYPPLDFANGIHRVGDRVFAIGSPFGLLNSLTAGVVSRLGIGSPELNTQSVSGSTFSDVRLRFLQTDLKLGPGNSGGPVIDSNGCVVGIATVRAEGLVADGHDAKGCGPGIGFAIETASIRCILRQMIADGRVKRAWLGFRGVGLNHEIVEQIESISQQNGLETIRHGVLVLKTYEDSPAARSNLRPGDVIVAVNGHGVKDLGNLLAILDASRFGAPAELRIQRIILSGNGSSNGKAEGRNTVGHIVSFTSILVPDEYDLFMQHKDKPLA